MSEFKQGDIVRYADGVSALFKVTDYINGRYYGVHVLGGYHGASDQLFNKLTLASENDIKFCKSVRPDWFDNA